jgi:hypothetical protein
MAWALTAGSGVSASEDPPSFRWVRQIGSPDYEYSYGLAVDPAGNCYLSGSFSSPQLAFGGFTLINRGQSDVFLASLETTTPRLDIGLVTDAVRLSWPASATDFFLESATNLSPAVVWSSHPATPTLVGSWNVVTVPADEPMKFYRFKHYP